MVGRARVLGDALLDKQPERFLQPVGAAFRLPLDPQLRRGFGSKAGGGIGAGFDKRNIGFDIDHRRAVEQIGAAAFEKHPPVSETLAARDAGRLKTPLKSYGYLYEIVSKWQPSAAAAASVSISGGAGTLSISGGSLPRVSKVVDAVQQLEEMKNE